MFGPTELQRIMDETMVSSVHYAQSLPSTNDFALQIGRRCDLELPLLVLTDQQTRGRGRRANRWLSGPGALTFSIVLDQAALGVDRARIGLASLWTALAVRAAVARFLPREEVQVKWPNDIYVASRKVSGVLIETVGGVADRRVVVGVGINVNNSLAGTPSDIDLSQTAVAMRQITGSRLDLPDILVEVLLRLEEHWQLAFRDGGDLAAAWEPYCALLHKLVVCRCPGQPFRGRCEGIDDNGWLLIVASETTHRCQAGVTLVSNHATS